MKTNNNKRNTFWACIIGMQCAFNVYAEESKIAPPMNKDQVDGRSEETKGTVKVITGKVLDDKELQVEGNVQKNLGKAQKGYGDVKQELKNSK